MRPPRIIYLSVTVVVLAVLRISLYVGQPAGPQVATLGIYRHLCIRLTIGMIRSSRGGERQKDR